MPTKKVKRPPESTPNPGSPDAVALGCLCPVMDNNHGKWAPYPPGGWWITAGCPVHARKLTRAEATDGVVAAAVALLANTPPYVEGPDTYVGVRLGDLMTLRDAIERLP